MSENAVPTEPSGAPRAARSLWPLWLIIAIGVMPFAVSYLAYYLWRPEAKVNYGELLPPRLLADAPLQRIDGAPFRLAELKGKWILVMVDSGACGEHCRQKLYFMRQLRLAQGREQDRVERLWLIADEVTPDLQLLASFPGTLAVKTARGDFIAQLPGAPEPSANIFVVDPFGNLMLRYPRDPDPRLMLKDLSRLLRASGSVVRVGK